MGRKHCLEGILKEVNHSNYNEIIDDVVEPDFGIIP
jgi:hypothetical protein